MTTPDNSTHAMAKAAAEITAHFELIGREGYVPCKMDENYVYNTLHRHFATLRPQWQPIETAPKTNRSILVFCSDNLCQYVVTWDAEGEKWRHFGGWTTVSVLNLTHWQPLPPSPQ